MQTEMKRTRLEVAGSLAKWSILGVVIEGETPLLMHSPASLMRREENVHRKTIPTPEEEAEMGLYRTEEGFLYLGADHLRQAVLEASKGLKIERRSLRQLLAAGLHVVVPQFLILRDGKPLRTYDRIDIRRAVVVRQGVLRARPVIEVPWQVKATFYYDEALLRYPGPVISSFVIAGQTVGVLDYRPQRGGPFGRFKVVEAYIEQLDDE